MPTEELLNKFYGICLPFLIFCAQERAVRRTHLNPLCIQPFHQRIGPATEGGPQLQHGTVALRFLSTHVLLRTSSSRNAFRCLLHSTGTPTTLPNCRVLAWPAHRFSYCVQERVLRGTHLDLSGTQPTPPPDCNEATLQNSRGPAFPFK